MTVDVRCIMHSLVTAILCDGIIKIDSQLIITTMEVIRDIIMLLNQLECRDNIYARKHWRTVSTPRYVLTSSLSEARGISVN